MKENYRQIGAEAINSHARMLTTQEIVAKASPDMSANTSESLYTFVEKNVTGFQSNGMDVLSIDIDHKPGELNPWMKAYINSTRTKLLLPEYFGPDIARHAPKLYKNKLYGSSKLQFAEQLAEELQNKPVAVSDIANRPRYEAIYAIHTFSAVPLALSSFFVDRPWLLLGVAAADFVHTQTVNFQEMTGTGVFNKDKVTAYERLVTDMEQARRLYIAKGVDHLTKKYAGNEEDKGQVVMLYPKAHGIRVADIVTKPHPRADKARGLLYKTIAPTLDYGVREFSYQTDEKNSEQKQWKLTKYEKLAA